ncbi:hypothetical protein ALC62_01041, partial [Cyphomyrmex costatus]
DTMYSFIFMSLTEVSDIVLNPPSTDKYTALKNRLVNSFADTTERKLIKLLNEVNLGDCRPSQLLRRMRDFAQKKKKNSVTEEVLKSLWLQRLLQQIQAILAGTKYNLEELSQLADRVTDVLPIGNNSVTTFTPTQATSTDSQISALQDRIEKLETRLSRSKSHTPSDRRRRSRSRSKSKNRLCWYHRHFGQNVTKCTQPCGWKTAMLENWNPSYLRHQIVWPWQRAAS